MRKIILCIVLMLFITSCTKEIQQREIKHCWNKNETGQTTFNITCFDECKELPIPIKDWYNVSCYTEKVN